MVNLPTQITDCDSHSPTLLDFFLSSDASICSKMAFPPLGNSDHVFVSVSTDFPSYSQQGVPFHCIAYDYSYIDWDGLRNVSWEDIFKLSTSAATSEFCKWIQVWLMCISLIESVRSSLNHLHGFQLLMLLPYLTFFVCMKRINLLNLKYSSDRLVIIAKRFLKGTNLHMLIKQESITSQKLGSQDFWQS